MRDKHVDYLNNELLDAVNDARKVEEEWLTSINALVKRLPKHVAEAVATRMFLSSPMVELTREVIERINFNRLMKGGKNNARH